MYNYNNEQYNNKQSKKGKIMKLGILGIITAVGVILLAFWGCNSTNPDTPAGYVGYITQGAMFGQAKFLKLQTGPTSTGLTWMAYARNISITPYTYSEHFDQNNSVLSKDNLKMSFQIHTTWRVKSEEVKEFIEKYTTMNTGESSDKVALTAYQNYIQQPLSSLARAEVETRNGLQIKEDSKQIGQTLTNEIRERAKGTPFEIMSVVIGNIQYPEQIANAVANKLAATQELQQRDTLIEIKRKDADIRRIDAHGIADAMDIVQAKLTPMYLQHEAIEAQKAMVGSPNHTTIYLPVGNNGVPLVSTIQDKNH